jgi:hypothetical protein
MYKLQPSPKGLIFTRIFPPDSGVELEVQLSPWLPSALRALYQGAASSRAAERLLASGAFKPLIAERSG